jgi:hypothetical protein
MKEYLYFQLKLKNKKLFRDFSWVSWLIFALFLTYLENENEARKQRTTVE